MSFPYISGNRTYHFLFSVQNDIENKNGFQCPGCKHHVLMDWILGKAARDGMRIRDIVSAVIVHNGTARCDSRQNTLAASGITSKKVRFNKSLRYNQICLACKAVKFNSVSVRTCAHIRKTSPVTVMDCIECGACAYTCPARLPLTHAFRMGKQKVNNARMAAKAKAEAEKAAAEKKEA